MSVNGCPNSCAHPHIVDIGLLGCKLKHEGSSVSGFELIVGGNLAGDKSKFGGKTGLKFISEDCPKAIEDLLNEFIKSDFENIQDFLGNKVNDK